MPRPIAAAVLVVVVLGATGAPWADVTATDQSSGFDGFVEQVGQTMLARFPEEVTDLGLSTALGQTDGRLNDLSLDYQLETARLAQGALGRLAEFDVSQLSPDQRITAAVTEWYLTDIVTMSDHLDHEYAVNYITGAHVNFPEFMADIQPIRDRAEAAAYVDRIAASGTQLRQVADNLARSERAGNLPTDTGLAIAAWQIGNQLTSPGRHPLVTDLEARLEPLELTDTQCKNLIDDARRAVEDDMLPAYEHLLGVVRAATTRPDSQPGVLYQPDGLAYYAAALRHHTTTSLTPGEIHQIGLEQVDRVRDELSTVLTSAGFDVETLGFSRAVDAASAAMPSIPLRSDADREALLSATEDFIDDAEGVFMGMFLTTPNAPLEVQRPRPSREGAGGAYYRPPPVSGERPGIYYLSLAGDAFGTATYATTNFHEAVPGHHFQIALQREAVELPLLQRATTFTGFAEGWALYAERLASEAGLYAHDPLGDIGRLRMELLRAARAVADTGIHALGWSRAQAVDYLVNLGFPVPWASAEVDRYIVWPGQAPAYLIGMLEILRLRAEAESALGAEFELARFHDAVLRHGSVPVEVLAQIVADYIAGAS